jgi:hypothetical protein
LGWFYFWQVHRCRESVDFSLQCSWLLDAYSSDASLPTQKKSHGTKLKNLILSEELRPVAVATTTKLASRTSKSSHLTVKVAPLSTKAIHQHSLEKENVTNLPLQVYFRFFLFYFIGEIQFLQRLIVSVAAGQENASAFAQRRDRHDETGPSANTLERQHQELYRRFAIGPRL